MTRPVPAVFTRTVYKMDEVFAYLDSVRPGLSNDFKDILTEEGWWDKPHHSFTFNQDCEDEDSGYPVYCEVRRAMGWAVGEDYIVEWSY